MDKSAIEQIQQSANIPEIIEQLDEVDSNAAILPDGFHIKSLEGLMSERFQFRGKMATANTDEFVRYNLKYHKKGSECFVEAEQMSALTVFDLGTTASPGHCHHKAYLSLKKTAAFKALLEINEERNPQKKLAEWVEDYAEFLEVYSTDGSKIEIPTVSSAIRNMKVEAKAGRESNVDDFSQHQSEYESIAARTKDELPMPAVFKFKCEPYLGLKDRTFEMRMSTIGNETLVLRIKKLEQHSEEMGFEFLELLERKFKELKVDVELFVGSFTS